MVREVQARAGLVRLSGRTAAMDLSKATVVFRTRLGEHVTANIEFERGQAFAVIDDYVDKTTGEVIKSGRVKLDRSLLQRVDRAKCRADYLYKGDPTDLSAN
jgi:hypothetical protein